MINQETAGTSSAFLDDKDKYFAPRAVPNTAFIDALVETALQSGDWRPSDKKIREQKLPTTVLEGAVSRNPGAFVPPEDLLPQDRMRADTQRYLRMVVDMVLAEAQRIHVHLPETLERLSNAKGSAITNVYQGNSVTDNSDHTYFDFNTGGAKKPEEISAEVRALVDAIRAEFRVGLEKLFSDPRVMKEIVRTAQVHEKVYVDVHMRDEVTRVERTRELVETPEEKKLFLKMMQQAVKVLGFTDKDLEVVLLDSKDAIFLMAQGLYTQSNQYRFLQGTSGIPSARALRNSTLVIDENGKYWKRVNKVDPGTLMELPETELVELESWQMEEQAGTPNSGYRKPRVAVPMSEYGSPELIEIDKAWRILAHEVAHHQMRELYHSAHNTESSFGKDDGEGGIPYSTAFTLNKDHHQLHNILTQMNLAKLRAMKFKFVVGPDGKPTDVQLEKGFDPDAALRAAKGEKSRRPSALEGRPEVPLDAPNLDGHISLSDMMHELDIRVRRTVDGLLESREVDMAALAFAADALASVDTTKLSELVERAERAAVNLEAKISAASATTEGGVLPTVVLDPSLPAAPPSSQPNPAVQTLVSGWKKFLKLMS